MCESDQRQPGTQIEITSAMIDAGVDALRAEWGYNVPDGEVALVSSVFIAMARVVRIVDAVDSK